MYHILHINWVVSNSASSATLYILTNHSPVLEGTHYVYKHVHIVIQQIYIDTLRCMQTCTEYCRSPYTEQMLSLNIQVELSSIIRHDNRHPILLQYGVRSKNIVSKGQTNRKRQTHHKAVSEIAGLTKAD